MRPFFSYYGAKWTMAKHYGPPRMDTVIEPFAGSACYSLYWEPKQVKLYDISPDICDLWDFLIHASLRDIEQIPDTFETFEEVRKLARGPQMLVRFWVAKGRAEPSGALSPWYFKYRNTKDCRVWGPAVKTRIVKQMPLIRKWKIDCVSWDKVPLECAHWHIDPPYKSEAGRRYPYASINYSALQKWVKRLPGHIDVCENTGADWLPFVPLHSVVTSRGRRSGARSFESVYRHDWEVGGNWRDMEGVQS